MSYWKYILPGEWDTWTMAQSMLRGHLRQRRCWAVWGKTVCLDLPKIFHIQGLVDCISWLWVSSTQVYEWKDGFDGEFKSGVAYAKDSLYVVSDINNASHPKPPKFVYFSEFGEIERHIRCVLRTISHSFYLVYLILGKNFSHHEKYGEQEKNLHQHLSIEIKLAATK